MPVRVNPVVPTGLHAHKQPAPQRVTPDYTANVFLTLVLKPNDHGHSLLVELAQPVVEAVDRVRAHLVLAGLAISSSSIAACGLAVCPPAGHCSG
jgi:hypothetical protein